MKTQPKISSNKFTFVFLALAVMLAFGYGCSTSKPAPDPLAGFYWSSLSHLDANKAITDDYKNYLHSLSPDEQKFAGPILYFEDRMGRHAVKIMIGINGVSWEHVLIYDKDDKRIKVIKYSTGNYRS